MSQIHGKQIVDSSVGLVKWDVSGSQGTFTLGTGSMIGVNDAPTNGTDLANKEYVDSVASGLDPKESVSVKSTANLASISGLLTIDGYTLLDEERVLLTDQTDLTENGIYIASAGTWSRATDSDGTPVNEVTLGNFTFVGTGSQWGSTGWVLSGTDATDGDVFIIPDTDTQVWVQFSDAAALLEGAGVDITGQIVSVDITNQGGLTFSIGGNSGTLQVETGNGIEVTVGGQVSADLFANGGLSFNGSEIQVDPTIAGDGSTWTSGVLNVVGGTGVTVNADDIEVDGSSLAGSGITWNSALGQFESTTGDVESVTAGAGLTGGGTQGAITLDVQTINGLSIVSDAVALGGTLTQDTTITGSAGLGINFTSVDDFNVFAGANGIFMEAASSDIDINTTISGDVNITSANTLNVSFSDSSITDLSGNGYGHQYSTDYSGTFITNSLITKKYVDDAIAVITGSDIEEVVAGSGLTGGGTQDTVTLDIGAGNGITVNADTIEVTAGTGVTVDGTGVNVDGSSLAGTGIIWNSVAGQFESTTGDVESVTAGAGLTGGGTQGAITLDIGAGTGITVNADTIEVDFSAMSTLAGDGLTWDGGNSEIDVVAGTGITVDGTGVNSNADGTLTANLVALGLTSGVNSIQEALTALLGDRTSLNSEQTMTAVASGGNNVDTTYDLVGTPATDHEVNLYVNGQLQRYGTAYDYYFSTTTGTGGARLIDAVQNGDNLIWNPTQAGFDLTTDDLITITYDELVV